MSTWIGLEVTCDDARWEKVNQLGEDHDAPHITLAYLGKPKLSELRRRELLGAVARWSLGSVYPIGYNVRVLGYDIFANGAVTVLKVKDTSASKRSLLRRQYQLVRDLGDQNFEVDQTYAFVPHVTVGHGIYVHNVFDVEDMILDVQSLFVSHNEQLSYINRRPQ